MCDIRIEASIFPTEEPEAVRQAVLNLFPDAAIEMAGGRLLAAARDAGHFAQRLADQRIRDTARTFLLQHASNGRLTFHLNKQAALMDRVNFTEGDSVLGDIRVMVSCPEPEALVERWTAHPEREAVP